MSKRIVFIGAPSCGKSTLATAVFTALKQADRNAEHVHEFIRHDIMQNGAMTSIWEQYRTRQYQKDLEDSVPATADFIICDSGTLTPYFYSVLYADATKPRQRLVLHDMHRYLLDDIYLNRYDMIFYLPLIPHVVAMDGTRFQTDNEITILDTHMELFFTKLHRTPAVHRVNSARQDRLDEVMWKILGVEKLSLPMSADAIADWEAITNARCI